jgi:pyridoxine kinase
METYKEAADQKKIIMIQDISCTGRCSATVAFPILSALGIETALVPTGILSTHTGGFGTPYMVDFTEHLDGILEHWKREKITASAVYAGYLASTEQMELVARFAEELGNLPLYVDPVMGDNGKLYQGFDRSYLSKMREFLSKADLIFPNLTEACGLLGIPYLEKPSQKELEDIIQGLRELGPDRVLLTGIESSDGKKIGNCYGDSKEISMYWNEKTEGHFHGTGDIFASVVIGSLLKSRSVEDGEAMKEAVSLASRFVCACIEKTMEGPFEERDGVRFELCLPMLLSQETDRENEKG